MLGKEQPLPLDIEFLVADTLEVLRPKLTEYKTYEDADVAVRALAEEMKAKLLAKQQRGVYALCVCGRGKAGRGGGVTPLIIACLSCLCPLAMRVRAS